MSGIATDTPVVPLALQCALECGKLAEAFSLRDAPMCAKSLSVAADELLRLHAEVARLAGEVSNRNRRALEGDKANAAFNTLYDEHEVLQNQARELVTAAKEVLRISDRKHDAWDRAKAAIFRIEGGAAT